MSQKTNEIDEAFIKRVYIIGVYVWGIFSLVLLSLRFWWLTLGWTLGCLVSIALLWSIEFIVRRTFVPGNDRAAGQFGSFSLLKIFALLPILGLVAWLTRYGPAVIFGFCGGALLTQSVILVKVLVIMIRQRIND